MCSMFGDYGTLTPPCSSCNVCLFDTLLFELDERSLDRFKLVWLIFGQRQIEWFSVAR